MASKNKEVLFGLFDDETQLLSAVADARKSHMEIDDVYTPFPVHGLDPLLGLEESRLHIAGFFYGLTGTATAFLEFHGYLQEIGRPSSEVSLTSHSLHLYR